MLRVNELFNPFRAMFTLERMENLRSRPFPVYTVKKPLCYFVIFTCRRIITVRSHREELTIAPHPKYKSSRRKKLDFDKLEWNKYISEEKLLEAISTVYGCDPRDEEKYKALLEAEADRNKEREQEESTVGKSTYCTVT